MYRQPIQLPRIETTVTSTALSVAATPVAVRAVASSANSAIAVTGWSFAFGTAFTGPYTLYLRRDTAGGTVVATLGSVISSTAVNLFYPIICPAGHDIYASVSLTVTGHTCDISLQYFHLEGQP